VDAAVQRIGAAERQMNGSIETQQMEADTVSKGSTIIKRRHVEEEG
jgi:hypothetical protein